MKAITETGEPAFRHKIGTELYDLFTFEASYMEELTVIYTIVKRTERYVYVHDRFDRPEGWPELVRSSDRHSLIRLSVDELERKGYAFNRANRKMLHTRPMPHWPLMPAVVRKPEQAAIGR